MTDIYKYAAQNELRFPSVRGDLTVEQLFDVPLTSASSFDLDAIARGINTELKAVSEESFVVPKVNPRKKPLEVSLEIVKDVIATKLAEAEALKTRREKTLKRQKLLDALKTQEDKALSEASKEELERQLAALDEEVA